MDNTESEAVVAKSLWNLDYFLKHGVVSPCNGHGVHVGSWGSSHAWHIQAMAEEGSFGFDSPTKESP